MLEAPTVYFEFVIVFSNKKLIFSPLIAETLIIKNASWIRVIKVISYSRISACEEYKNTLFDYFDILFFPFQLLIQTRKYKLIHMNRFSISYCVTLNCIVDVDLILSFFCAGDNRQTIVWNDRTTLKKETSPECYY